MSSKRITIPAQDTSVVSSRNYVKMILRYLASNESSNALHNISNVDVNKYCQERVEMLEEFSHIFVDNVMLYRLVDESKTVFENRQRLLNTHVRKSSNHEIKFIFESCGLKLRPLDVKIKSVVVLQAANESYESYIRSRVI